MQKILLKDEALPLIKSGMAIKEKILATKAESYLNRLKAFEKKHKMKSREFMLKFKSGKLGDASEWFDWLFVYEAYQKIIEQKKILKNLAL
ncbi:MAG: hypothetical protein WCQ99_07305 [Pseudomonadota bacterium]